MAPATDANDTGSLYEGLIADLAYKFDGTFNLTEAHPKPLSDVVVHPPAPRTQPSTPERSPR